MAEQWYVAKDGQRLGPYTTEEVEQYVNERRIEPGDLVWRDGMREWLPAREVLAMPRQRDVYRDRERRPRRDDYEEEPHIGEPQRTSMPNQFPGRLITPAFFLLLLLVFLLPWVDVRCNSGLFNDVCFSQSGVQLCLGTYSETSFSQNQRAVNQQANALKDDKIKPAPMVIVHLVAILAGLALGLALPVGMVRLTATGLAAFLAMAVLIVQANIGFPIQEQVDKANADPAFQKMNNNNLFGAPNPFGPNPFGPNPFVNPPSILTVHTTPWFWFAVILPLTIAGSLALEHLCVFVPRPVRRGRY